MSLIKRRIIEILEFKGIAKEDFYKKIGITSANFRGKAKDSPLNSDTIEKIFSEIDDINPYWLLTGKGNMLCTTNNPYNNHLGTDNDHNQNSIDMNTDKLIAVIESQNVMIRQKDEEIRQLRAELDELRGYSPIKKSRVG